MTKFICGQCSRKQNLSLEERKQLALEMSEGKNKCDCGRIVELHNNRLTVIKEDSVLN